LKDFEQLPIPKGVNVHWFVINHMKGSPNNAKRIIGADLDRLRALRNLADYEDELFDQFNRANQALMLTKNIFEDLRKLTF
jgi:hypothetical protein